MQNINGISLNNLLDIAIPFAVFLAALFAGLIFKKIVLSRLIRWAAKTESRVDDIIVETVRKNFTNMSLLLGAYLALWFSKLSPDIVMIAAKILLAIVIFIVTLIASNLSARLIRSYSARVPGLPATTLTVNISRIFVFGIGILIILNSLGIAITPILATLGVGSLAVALALQDTLSNMFAGINISMARNLRVGDFVKLESGEEGYIVDIGWRATKVKMLPNNTVIIPNNKLAQTVVTNYYLPEQEMAVLVQVGVHYESDLKHVERVTIEVGKEIMKEVQGGVPTFEPFIRYHTFADFSINFTVILRAKEFVDNYLIKHEFIKRLHERYKKEGICIPYPIRAINYAQEKLFEHGTGK